MATVRLPKRKKCSKILFYPEQMLPEGASRLSFLALTHPNYKIRARGLDRLVKQGKLRQVVEFMRKVDFSQIPVSYFGTYRRGRIDEVKSAISEKENFLHRGRIIHAIKGRLKFGNLGGMMAGRVIISKDIKGGDEKETQVFRECVAEHELGHFVDSEKYHEEVPMLMETLYAFEKGKLNEWLNFVNKNLGAPDYKHRLFLLEKHYPEIYKKLEIHQ